MKLIFYVDYIRGNEVLFWVFISSIIIMILLSIIFVRKETRNESK